MAPDAVKWVVVFIGMLAIGPLVGWFATGVLGWFGIGPFYPGLAVFVLWIVAFLYLLYYFATQKVDWGSGDDPTRSA